MIQNNHEVDECKDNNTPNKKGGSNLLGGAPWNMKPIRRSQEMLIGVAIILIIFLIIWVGSWFVGCLERADFITTSILDLLIFLAISIQACIYIKQWKVMESQWKAMESQLSQNKKLIKATQAASYPYMGVTDIQFSRPNPGDYPLVKITFLNGGQTPARQFYADVQLILGDTPDSKQVRNLISDLGDVFNSFIPQQEHREIEYLDRASQYAQEQINGINRGTLNVFVVVKTSYLDMGKLEHGPTFNFVWYNSLGKFGDYDIAQRRQKDKGNAQ